MSSLSETSIVPGPSPRGVLIVVMGTSGTGKSTLGISLGERFGIPFVDGDDLHPPANVSKMSAGMPLDDDDRLPWLLRIRHTAFELTDDAIAVSGVLRSAENQAVEEAGRDGKEAHKKEVRRMAEVLETSKQPDADDYDQVRAEDKKKGYNRTSHQNEVGGSNASQSQNYDHASSPSPSPRRACLIACSALKRRYRNLLRADSNCETYPDADHPSKIPGQSLDVYFLYIRVPEQELIRRMHERKAHFMKESMLRSQLETLEEPDEKNEPGVLTLDGVGSKIDVEHRADVLIAERVGTICGPRYRPGVMQ
ncbi:unnamed protein product [Tilletia laevis]|uniref:gluconokinase n=2 Tax=Tilletia TaxID=13289 RepID=A0A177V6U7_9BASI|nr:hypothetical protein CF336_g4476 [Tilletia laevis]KAE8260896.1 hypothetical protein A4X03_0g3669 [Tilletia caries]CAD6972687.1 unnamed protein product [Tilletia controversa]KAE8202237.1 hypothetical protein CF335_g3499 [Tilletia laevis]CAD6887222.1 unnamed protein product [Tilletia caries]